jgi:hypothetical protein
MRAGEPLPTPIWLADADYAAPCPCGRPMDGSEPVVLGKGETGLMRLFHISCVQSPPASGRLGDDDDE